MNISKKNILLIFIALVLVSRISIYVIDRGISNELNKTCVSEISGTIKRLERHNGMVKIFIEGYQNDSFLLGFALGIENNDATSFLQKNRIGFYVSKEKKANIIYIDSNKWFLDCD